MDNTAYYVIAAVVVIAAAAGGYYYFYMREPASASSDDSGGKGPRANNPLSPAGSRMFNAEQLRANRLNSQRNFAAFQERIKGVDRLRTPGYV